MSGAAAARGGDVGIGLLGCGVIAYWAHLRALRRMSGVRLAAAADPDPAARERARRLTGAPVVSGLDALLARPDVEAVVVSVPTQLHADAAVAAAIAGRHVYLEKPIATTVADARRVIDAAERAGVVGAIGFNRRFHPLYRQARGLLRAGAIGRVRGVLTAFCEPLADATLPPWRRERATGGGVLLDLASHHVDLLRWFLDDEPVTALATLRSERTEHDSARLELTLRGGVEAQSWFSYRAALADFIEFFGERGTLRVDRHSPALRLGTARRLGYGVRWRRPAPPAEVLAWRLHRLVRPSVDPSYRRSLQAWVARIRGRPGDPASLDDGLRSLEVVLAAEASARPATWPASERPPVPVPCARC